jgi:small subunit ribosomal protein S7
MSRRSRSVKRPIASDPIYGSETVTKFINNMMYDGKKSLAEGIFYDAMRIIEEKSGQPGEAIFKQALSNAKPVLEVKSRRVGGATYQVPVEVRSSRSMTLALRWLVGFAQQRREKTMTERLMNEILDASNGLGAAVKRREDMHKMAESNRAFAHYRW